MHLAYEMHLSAKKHHIGIVFLNQLGLVLVKYVKIDTVCQILLQHIFGRSSQVKSNQLY